MLKTYKFKTHCNGDSHSSKSANIILPGLLIKQRWTSLRLQAKWYSNSLNCMHYSGWNNSSHPSWIAYYISLADEIHLIILLKICLRLHQHGFWPTVWSGVMISSIRTNYDLGLTKDTNGASWPAIRFLRFRSVTWNASKRSPKDIAESLARRHIRPVLLTQQRQYCHPAPSIRQAGHPLASVATPTQPIPRFRCLLPQQLNQ